MATALRKKPAAPATGLLALQIPPFLNSDRRALSLIPTSQFSNFSWVPRAELRAFPVSFDGAPCQLVFILSNKDEASYHIGKPGSFLLLTAHWHRRFDFVPCAFQRRVGSSDVLRGQGFKRHDSYLCATSERREFRKRRAWVKTSARTLNGTSEAAKRLPLAGTGWGSDWHSERHGASWRKRHGDGSMGPGKKKPRGRVPTGQVHEGPLAATMRGVSAAARGEAPDEQRLSRERLTMSPVPADREIERPLHQ